ncbi:bacillithiol biosynthesis cysteine-adding enzyme BshC [Paenibacillus lentus]|uniref:Putative cysteine ligase BshC n=1 Tax=Paenibacillus lentus TaxID=1338368 RepID=A0A3S8RVB4_9BACL|nr:bacillithiol biosynthesis cysteine-adding enzyme BshC [Paenibacillus lentus]AZK46878.1 bacillithiol biosynthesis cysteine-adding enzyme BshC [Paenibacillus lentus]
MNVVQEPLQSGQPLAESYLSDFQAVEHLFGGHPAEEGSWSARLQWLDRTEHLRAGRRELVQRLRQYNERFNPNPAVTKSLSKLGQPGTVVIVGGQQSGLFTGPLLVIYKAITIIKAAERASKQLGRDVVPVFWIAGEDHDWDEVDHTYVLSPELEVSRIRIPREDGRRGSVSYTVVKAEEWERAVRDLDQLLPDSEFKADLLGQLRDALSVSASLTEAFARLLGTWFGKYGLVLLDSADPTLRRLEVPMFEAMIRSNDELESAYHAASRDITSLGYRPQAEVAEGGANLFYIAEGERLLLFKRGDVYTDRKGLVAFSREALIAELHRHPERFSNNVLTRPLMQDYLLPVLGSVLGNGEIAYWGLTGKAFELLELRMPLLLPRMSFTIMDDTTQKHMDKYSLSWEDVIDHTAFTRIKADWLAKQDKLQLDAQFAEMKRAFAGLYDPLIEQLGQVEKGLIKLGNTNKTKIIEQMDFLQVRVKEAMERSNEAGLRHFDRIEFTLFPQHKPQERVFNIYAYLNRYGIDWIDRLMEVPYEMMGQHRMVYA